MWSVDELAPPLFGLIIGMIFGMPIICFVIGLCMNHFYRLFRDNHPNGYLIHLGYFIFGIPLKGACFKHPFRRFFF